MGQVYLLSILDGLNACLLAVALIAFCSGFWTFVLWLNDPVGEGGEGEKVLYKRLIVFLSLLSLVCVVLRPLVPTRRDIVEAYFIVEGAKVLTAENAEAALKEMNSKTDRVIGIIERAALGDQEGK